MTNTQAERGRARHDPASGGLILLYHRVIEPLTDPQLLCVWPARFREHLEILRREFNPISLDDLINAMPAGRIRKRSVVITFDDGYFDNAEIAAPMLGEFNIAATFFVTARDEEAREFWWDELERIILRTPRLPVRLTLRLGEQRHSWQMTDGSNARPCHERWHVLCDEPPTHRQVMYLFLCGHLRALLHDHRRGALDALCQWAGLTTDGRSSHRPMTPPQIRGLAASGLIEIGAHTVTHPVLSTLPQEAQADEIAQSRTRLEAITGRPVTSFAYPFGCPSDFGPEAIRAVRNAGLRCACANTGNPPSAAAVVSRASHRFALPRTIVRNWDGETFARHLRRAFAGMAPETRRHAHAAS